MDVGIKVLSNIPAGHKIAVKPIAAGENVIRYGQVMGRARVAIAAGEHVHTHNVGFEELVVSIPISDGQIWKPLRFRGTFPLFSVTNVKMAAQARATTSLSSPQVTAPPILPSRSQRAIR